MSEKVQVTVKSGPIEGIRKTTRLDTPYISFQKIPYAKPALGQLRFKVNLLNLSHSYLIFFDRLGSRTR